MDDAFLDRLAILENEIVRLRSDIAAARTAPSIISERPAVQQQSVLHERASIADSRTSPEQTSTVQTSESTRAFEALVAGRGLQLTGLLLVLIGAAFFLDLAFTHNWIGPAERIAIGLAAGAALIAFGTTRLREPWLLLGQGLIGLGAGIMYLAIWASVAVFPDLHVARAAAFAAMIAVTVVLGILAARTRSERIALLGLVGGFLTPVLLNDGPANQPILAAYLVILSAGMLAVSARASFRFVEGAVFAGVFAYTTAFVPSTGWSDGAACVVATLFLFEGAAFLTIAELRGALQTEPSRTRRVQTTVRATLIALGVVAYIAIVESLFADRHLVVGAILVGLTAALLSAARLRLSALVTFTYAGSGLGALTLAVPAILHTTVLTMDAYFVEALVLVSIGSRANSDPLKYIGAALYGFALLMLVVQTSVQAPGVVSGLPLLVAYGLAIGALIIARRLPVVTSKTGVPTWQTFSSLILTGLIFFVLSRECLDIFGGPHWNEVLPSGAQFALSAVWTMMATVLFVIGIRRRDDMARWEALAIFTLTIGKVFTVDLTSLSAEYRIGSFVGLGIVLVTVSTWYTRSAIAARNAGSDA